MFEIKKNGFITYYIDSKIHREDGPAVIWHNGGISYHVNNKRHRKDGPAIFWANGHAWYYSNGTFVTNGGKYI